jgi:hypothetical protein
MGFCYFPFLFCTFGENRKTNVMNLEAEKAIIIEQVKQSSDSDLILAL